MQLAKRIPILPPLQRNARAGAGTPVIIPNEAYAFATKTAVSSEGETLLLDPDADPTLAADFIAPLAAYFQALPEIRDRINGVLVPEKYPPEDRLIRVADTPGKTPIILVHGLGSSPHTWKKLSAAFLTSPEFRTRYSLWHYRYPTGAPLETNARRFILDLGDTFEGGSAQAVIVGHSMGGLLALAAAADPLSSEDIASIILLASPASGNWFATLHQAKIASSLPGIADLSSSSEFITNLAKQKIPKETPVHIVLGRKLTFDDGSFSDGIVRSTDAYTSPTSTYIVPTHGHQIHHLDRVITHVTKLLGLPPAS